MDFPTYMFHRDHGKRVFNTAEEFDAAGDGWVDSPTKVGDIKTEKESKKSDFKPSEKLLKVQISSDEEFLRMLESGELDDELEVIEDLKEELGIELDKEDLIGFLEKRIEVLKEVRSEGGATPDNLEIDELKKILVEKHGVDAASIGRLRKPGLLKMLKEKEAEAEKGE